MLTEKDVYEGFGQGICCAMAVFGEMAPEIGLDKETAYKIASGFGSGIGHGSACGCVTGAIMALGYKFGNSGPGQYDKKDLVKEKREAFLKEYKERFGHFTCQEHLEDLNPMVPEDRKIIDEKELMRTVCPPMVSATCEIVRKLLQE